MLGIQRWIKLLWSLPHCSVTKSCLTLHDPMDCSMPGFPVLHYLPELAQTHVHWAVDAIQSSHPLLPHSLSALNLSQHHPDLFSNESALCIRWPKYWSFSFSISPSNEYSWPLAFTGFSPCCPRGSQESSLGPQFKGINSLALNFFYGSALTLVHAYCKNQ